MSIIKLSAYRRPIVFFLILPMAFLLYGSKSFAREEEPDAGTISNVNWKIEGDFITITYDLKGNADQKYEVVVAMLRENVSGFKIIPQTVDGDIGEGLFAGVARQIRWNYRKDFPPGFQGEGYYFEIRVKPVTGDNKWIYYALGAAALAGGVVAILVGTSQAENAPKELPFPPGRP